MSEMWKSYRLDTCLFEPPSIQAPILRATARISTLPPRVDLRPLCSKVEDQGQVGSCAANAVVGALEYHQRKAGLNVTDLSRLFVYYNARNMANKTAEDCGTMISHVMASVLAFGACEERLWPYIEAMWPEKPTQACYGNALRYEAVSYARAPLGDACLIALAQGLPIVFGTFLPSDFYGVAAQTGVVPEVSESVEAPGGGHAMLLVGYDLPTRTWLVRNSWSEKFADRGYFRIPFSTLNTYSMPDGFWTIGAIEVLEGVQLHGLGVREAMRAASMAAPNDVESSLERLRKNIRKKLNTDLEEKRKDVRDRLRGPGVGGGY
ncbi:MAG: C1 family peptidase [Hyphomonadaceae bacterium]